MPITSPLKFKSGPPELPGLIAASVCITLSIVSEKPSPPEACLSISRSGWGAHGSLCRRHAPGRG